MTEKIWDITELSALEKATGEILETSAVAKGDGATVLALHGDLGTGKTTFTQTLARALGVMETVNSPTFVIMKKYPIEGDYQTLVHIDAYRVESIDEMTVLGFANLLEEKDTIICIEWAERIADLLPADSIHLSFELVGEKRLLKYGR